MKYVYGIFLVALLGMFSCNTEQNKEARTELMEKITRLEQGAFNNQTLEYNRDTALLLIKAYQSFIEQYPEDTAGKNYAYLNAQLSQSIKLYGEAIRKYQDFSQHYPEDEKAAKALIMVGLIYETNLKDTVNAKKAYEIFLEKYPTHPMAKDIKTMIQFLSLSDKELMEMLKSKSQQSI